MKDRRNRIMKLAAALTLSGALMCVPTWAANMSPSTIIYPIGDTTVDVTEPEKDPGISDVIGTVHVNPTQGSTEVTMYVPGVEPGQTIKVYLLTPEGYYIEADAKVIGKNKVVVTIEEEGDLVITTGDEDEEEEEFTIIPTNETEPETDVPPDNPPTSPKTADGTTNPYLPLSLAGLFGLASCGMWVSCRKDEKGEAK